MPNIIRSEYAKKIIYYLGVLLQVGGPLVAIDYRNKGALVWIIALGGFTLGTFLLAVSGNLPGTNKRRE